MILTSTTSASSRRRNPFVGRGRRYYEPKALGTERDVQARLEKIRRILEELGYEIATPAEARASLLAREWPVAEIAPCAKVGTPWQSTLRKVEGGSSMRQGVEMVQWALDLLWERPGSQAPSDQADRLLSQARRCAEALKEAADEIDTVLAGESETHTMIAVDALKRSAGRAREVRDQLNKLGM